MFDCIPTFTLHSFFKTKNETMNWMWRYLKCSLGAWLIVIQVGFSLRNCYRFSQCVHEVFPSSVCKHRIGCYTEFIKKKSVLIELMSDVEQKIWTRLPPDRLPSNNHRLKTNICTENFVEINLKPMEWSIVCLTVWRMDAYKIHFKEMVARILKELHNRFERKRENFFLLCETKLIIDKLLNK